jgi:tetratricopeptide (TPR) repeat protein
LIRKDFFVQPKLNTPPDNINLYNSQFHTQLTDGDWDGLYRTASELLQREPLQPVAVFIKNIACLFINPPDIIKNKKYLESVGNKDWKAVLQWWQGFFGEPDQHNPNFQAINFILQSPSKKVATIEGALQEHPNHAELLFLQSISLRDRTKSIEKLKLAVENKPEFPAALYLLGIFSLQMHQVEAAEDYLKKAINLAPDFLEAHYQLGSLYSLYIPDSKEQATVHFQKVVELDPEGGAGKDAKKVLENNSQPQFGQRIGGSPGSRRGGMSMLTILGVSLLTVWLFAGPISNVFKINNPTIGIVAGLFVFVGLYSAWGRKK